MSIRGGIRSFQNEDETSGGTTSFDIEAQAEIEMSGEEATSLESANNAWPGVSVKQSKGSFDMTIIDAGTLSLTKLQACRKCTATAVGANGKTYAIKGSVVGKIVLDMLEGKVPVKIEGIVTERVARSA